MSPTRYGLRTRFWELALAVRDVKREARETAVSQGEGDDALPAAVSSIEQPRRADIGSHNSPGLESKPSAPDELAGTFLQDQKPASTSILSPKKKTGRQRSSSLGCNEGGSTNLPSTANKEDGEEVIRRASYNSTDTTREKTLQHAVTHETVRTHVHHITHRAVYREIHEYDVMHRVQPVVDIELLPARHFVQEGEELKEVDPRDLPGRTVDRAEIQEAFMRAVG